MENIKEAPIQVQDVARENIELKKTIASKNIKEIKNKIRNQWIFRGMMILCAIGLAIFLLSKHGQIVTTLICSMLAISMALGKHIKEMDIKFEKYKIDLLHEQEKLKDSD